MADEMTREQMRDEYLSRVAALFDQAKAWTTQFDPKATFAEKRISIKEEPVADYEATVLVITRPDCKPVSLVPRGCWIIGAAGRVDMKSDLGTETLVYVLDGGPAIQFTLRTENGKILEEGKPRPFYKDVKKGWSLIQNRQLGMLPTLDADLFCRLLEVLGR